MGVGESGKPFSQRILGKFTYMSVEKGQENGDDWFQDLAMAVKNTEAYASDNGGPVVILKVVAVIENKPATTFNRENRPVTTINRDS